MTTIRLFFAATLSLLLAGTAHADPICADRPGLTTAPCVLDARHVQFETGLGDWTLDKSGGARTDTVLIGDTLLRYGLGSGFEARIEWTPYGIVRTREDGAVSHSRGIGDVTIGFKKTLIDGPDGDGTGLALTVLPSATLPAGHGEIGDGTWSAGVAVPLQYTFSPKWSLQATPEIDAAADDDGRGRHAAYGSALVIAYNPVDAVQLQATGQVLRDDDPDRTVRGTRLLAGAALAVLPDEDLQLDLGSNLGLNRDSPDVEVYAGISKRF